MNELLDWLLDSDPSIRWRVMRDLTDEPDDVIAAERARVAREGWGARLLELQSPDGRWGTGPGPFSTYIETPDGSALFTLILLLEMGLDPSSDEARRAVARVRDHLTHYEGGKPFFAGETEPCINGRVVRLGACFGEIDDALVDRLLHEQLADGGWNCEAPRSTRSSFHTTICVLEGLLEYERWRGPVARVTEARTRGEEYLLERRLFRSRSTGRVIDREWMVFSFPAGWHYDVLRGLDYLRGAGTTPGDRIAEALDIVARNRLADGRWPLRNPQKLPPHLGIIGEEDGGPSRWNTLRALRVLRWAEGVR